MPLAEVDPQISKNNAASHASSNGLRFWLVLGLYLVLMALTVCDRMVEDLRPRFVQLMLVALVLIDCPPPKRWGRERVATRLLITLAGLGLTLWVAQICRWSVDRTPQALDGNDLRSIEQAWRALFKHHAYAVWGASLWIFAPLVQTSLQTRRERAGEATAAGVAPEEVPDQATAQARLVLLHALPLMGFGAWSLATSLSSIRPDRGFQYFVQELGLYVPLYLFWVRSALRDARYQVWLKRGACAFMLLATLAASVVFAMFWLADEAGREAMKAFEFRGTILVTQQFIGSSQWRFNFPFGHHNRLGYFSGLCVVVFFMVIRLNGRTWVRVAAGVGLGLALLNLGATLNRGAFFALAGGVAAYACLSLGRRSLWLLLLAPIGLLVMTQNQRNEIATIFKKDTYTNQYSSIVTRVDHWRFAVRTIRENPVLGIGYGWKHFEKYYQASPKQEGEREYAKAHAHNAWLEWAAESGLPALALWGAWNGLRWWLMLWLWRRRGRLVRSAKQQLFLWIALEVLVQLFCLVNLPLRRALGFLTWGLWAVMTVDLLGLRHSLESPGPKNRAGTLPIPPRT